MYNNIIDEFSIYDSERNNIFFTSYNHWFKHVSLQFL